MDYLNLIVWTVLSCAAIHYLILSLIRSKKKLPPGPTPLPIIGNLLMMDREKPHIVLMEQAKIHGPIMSIQLGAQYAIVITSASIAKEVLQKNDAKVCNRAVTDAITAFNHHQFSFLFMPVGDRWKSYRRIASSHVFSGTQLDSSRFLRMKKLEELLSHVKMCSQVGEAVEIGQVVFTTTLNLLSNTFFSVDLARPNSSTSRDFQELFRQIVVVGGIPNYADFFPVLKLFDLQRIKKRMRVHLEKMNRIFNSIISQRLNEKHGCSNDALDALLKISRDNGEELELPHIPHFLQDLFVAGTDTTTTTIEWAMTELLCNPDKMKKAREELESVVGRGVPIKEEDISRLPYLQAIIKEIFRKNSPVSLISRKVISEFEVCGFKVPKNTQIIINLCAIGKDPTLWKNPNSFEPERFLDKEIDIKGKDYELIPFGAGRRICPGLPLAMRMIPLMLGSLINCFEWKLEDGVDRECMNMDDIFGLAMKKAQPLRAIPISIV